MLVSQEKVRKQLKVVAHGSCSTEQLRCFGSGRIYIRPLQKSIPLTEVLGIQEEYEVCLACDNPVAVSEMRDHQESCEVCISPDKESTYMAIVVYNLSYTTCCDMRIYCTD